MRWVCQAVRERAPVVDYLRRHLPIEVIWEDGRGPLVTAKRAFEALEDGPGVIVQDDILLARNAGPRMLRAIAEHPDAVVSFFTVTKADGWLPARQTLRGALALAYPHGAARELATYRARWPLAWMTTTAWDVMVGDWCKENGVRVWVEVPNLVEHLGLPSTLGRGLGGRRSRSRRSASFTDPEWDGFPMELAPK